MELVIGLLIGIVVASAVAFVVGRQRIETSRAEADRALAVAESKVGILESQIDGERRLSAQLRASWEEARDGMQGQFASLSAAALKQNSEQFLHLAQGRMDLAQQSQKGQLDNSVNSIEKLLAPIADQLTRYDEGVRQLESHRQSAYAGLMQQVQQLNDSQTKLQSETRRLVTALRAPATRGRWGEQQLKRVMEMAGMLEHCDFSEQVTTESESGRLRPDAVVHLSGGRTIVIDSKVPLEAFLDANDSTDESEQKTHLARHARQVRSHVESLAKKSYNEQFESSPEFVVAFIPGDTLLQAAFEQDPSLFEHSIERNVVLATPTNLIAILRSIAFSWQQESIAENAIKVQKAGRELYKRLGTFGKHFAKAGSRLGSAVDAYNDAVGSLERNVLPQARRFCDLGASGSDQLPEAEQIDSKPRHLQAAEFVGRDERRTDGDVAELVAIDGEVTMLPFASNDAVRARQR